MVHDGPPASLLTCLFEGSVPTVKAVTQSQLTKATGRATPYNPVCESIQNEGHA